MEVLTAYSHSVQAADLRLCPPWRSPAPETEREAAVSLRERLDEHDTAELITTYRAKAWSMHLIAAAQLWVLRDQE